MCCLYNFFNEFEFPPILASIRLCSQFVNVYKELLYELKYAAEQLQNFVLCQIFSTV